MEFEAAKKQFDSLIKFAAYRYAMQGNPMLEYADLVQTGLRELHRTIVKYGDKPDGEVAKIFKTYLFHSMASKIQKWKLSARRYAPTVELTDFTEARTAEIYPGAELDELVDYIKTLLTPPLETRVLECLVFSSDIASRIALEEARICGRKSVRVHARHFAIELGITPVIFKRTVASIRRKITEAGIFPRRQ